jgi:hypothetical protein
VYPSPSKSLSKPLKNLNKRLKNRNNLFYLFLMKSLSKQNRLRRLKLKTLALTSLNYSPRVMEI